MANDIVPSGAESTTAPQGTTIPDGEPTTGTEQNQESQQVPNDVQAGGEPSGEGLPDGFDSLENAAKMYKDIQKLVSTKDTQYSELKSQLSEFEKFGGVDAVAKWAEALTQNQDFHEWIQDQQRKNSYGIDPSTLDEDSMQAIQLIEKVSTQKAQELINQIVNTQLTPIVESNRKASIQGHFNKLEEKYSNWRDVSDVMDKLTEQLPPNVADNPSYRDIEALYLMALVDSGKVDDFAANIYKQKLEQKKSQASDRPPTKAGNAAPKRATSVAEAFAMAKQALSSGGGGL